MSLKPRAPVSPAPIEAKSPAAAFASGTRHRYEEVCAAERLRAERGAVPLRAGSVSKPRLVVGQCSISIPNGVPPT
jgi:hypothetical protein